LKEPYFFTPILDAFVRAMPFTYQDVIRPEGTRVTLEITGDSGGLWTIQREGEDWVLYMGTKQPVDTKVTIGQEDAWRLFTKGIDPATVRARSKVTGDAQSGAHVFEMVSIIA
jgi:hypothetical protein